MNISRAIWCCCLQAKRVAEEERKAAEAREAEQALEAARAAAEEAARAAEEELARFAEEEEARAEAARKAKREGAGRASGAAGTLLSCRYNRSHHMRNTDESVTCMRTRPVLQDGHACPVASN